MGTAAPSLASNAPRGAPGSSPSPSPKTSDVAVVVVVLCCIGWPGVGFTAPAGFALVAREERGVDVNAVGTGVKVWLGGKRAARMIRGRMVLRGVGEAAYILGVIFKAPS